MPQKIAIAIDLGATNTRVALVDITGKILDKRKELTVKKGKNGAVIAEQIIAMIDSLIKGKKITKFSGIGISSFGPLDYKRGGVWGPNVPFKFIPLVKPLKNKFKLPVILLNDCRAAVLGEKYFGLGKKSNNLVYITISSGIGGGAIINGNLILGQDGNAGEIGHMTVDSKYNFTCNCGRGYGHWEGLASGENLPNFFKFWLKKNNLEVNFKYKTSENIFYHANINKIANRFIVDEIGKINARAISNIIALYNPDLITIGGSVALNNKSLILNPILKNIDHYLRTPKIKITALGDDIGLLGAAAAVFNNINFVQ